MSDRLVEGLWDCPYCGAKAIGGRKKYCPACGHPQDKDTKFYLGEEKIYLDQEESKAYGKGPDWLCAYCSSLNNARFEYCTNCGAPREEAAGDYFTKNTEQNIETNQREANPGPATDGQKEGGIGAWLRRHKVGLIVAGIVLALLAVMGAIFMPRNQQATVAGKDWERTVEVEEYRTVQESDWSLPSGGRLLSKKEEIHHYDTVLDHYETKSREVSEEVLDGYDQEVEYIDNGDGTFTEHVTQVPRYRTEYHTEYYEDPVYIEVPRFQTKYYYEIDRWVYDRTEKSTGKEETPQWPTLSLEDNEREGAKKAIYRLTIKGKKDKEYTVKLSEARWSFYKKGDPVSITTSAGRVIKLDGVDVGD